MIIKQYGEFPVTYTPDVGEIVYARRSPTDRWTKAVVVGARRVLRGPDRGRVRVHIVWIDADPHAGVDWKQRRRKPILPGDENLITIRDDQGVPPLLMQVDRDTPPPVSSSRPARTESDGPGS